VTDEFKIIKSTVIDGLEEVRLYDETVDKIRRNHPEVPIELPSLHAAVENAIIQPTHVESSHEGSYVFVDSETTNRSGDPLRVPVKPLGSGSGRVRTAYFASTATRPIIWRRKDG
jgi:hypothetical protein